MRGIWAQSRDGVIGDGLDMPWHVPEDLAHFKRTTGHDAVLMGRATWESIPERFRPLPGRRNVVVSSKQPGSWSEGAEVLASLPEHFDGWVMGGGSIYEQLLPQMSHLVITEIDAILAGVLGERAVYAPSTEGFELVECSPWQESERGVVRSEAGERSPVRYRIKHLRARA